MNFKYFHHIILLVLLVTFGLCITSCGKSASEIAEIVSERDSLRNETKRQSHRLENLDRMMDIVNSGLDSIATQEGILFNGGTSESLNSKEDILKNVERLQSLVSNQKERINQLEAQLKKEAKDDFDGNRDTNLENLISHLKAQLAEKDRQIANLKNQLAEKDVNIANLQSQIGMHTRTIQELDRRNTAQAEALKRQDAELNHCYMIIGSKKDLERKGIVKKGKLVANAALDRSKFVKVDIRQFTQCTFTAKKVKILTSMPASSYSLTTDGNHNFILSISDPTAFWSISNYLVIETN